ncbi:MAG TPA: ThiF family adenylyltransferase, partial [Thermoanaerobaculia bacterium]
MTTLLRMTEQQVVDLHTALHKGDGREAVAFALVGRCASERDIYLVRSIITVSADAYLERRPDRVRWRTDVLPPILDRVAREGLSLMKLHSHATEWPRFSDLDDESDRSLSGSVSAWTNNPSTALLSAVMLPNADLVARVVRHDGSFLAVDGVDIIGDDLRYARSEIVPNDGKFGAAFAQAFGAGTFARMRQLCAVVVGCSGTGSIVIEQLARNGIGKLIIIDPDFVEDRNLNRILNTFATDAANKRPKVEVLKEAVEAMGTGTIVQAIGKDAFTPAAVRAITGADMIFGCVDTIDARHLLNQIASFYLMPYFDLGVKIEADGRGGVSQVCGSVHYLRPGGGSLLSRSVYTLEDVRAAAMRRVDPEHYAEQVERGYVRGAAERRPAVISVNMLIASLAVNDLLARLHPYRIDGNASHAIQRVSL